MESIGVVVPTHGRRSTLVQALVSIAVQDRRPDVVVVAVDGPDNELVADAVSAAAALCRDTRWERVSTGAAGGQGAGATRNLGVQRAGTDVIAFLDDDDLWLPHHLDAAERALAGIPEAAFYAPHIDVRPGRPTKVVPRPPLPSGWIPEHVVYGPHPINMCTLVVRRRHLLAAGGFDASFVRSQDTDLFLRLARQVPFVAGDAAAAVIRRHDLDPALVPERIAARRRILDRYARSWPVRARIGAWDGYYRQARSAGETDAASVALEGMLGRRVPLLSRAYPVLRPLVSTLRRKLRRRGGGR